MCRIVKEKTLQSESLVRIQTSCSQPREGNPSWVESFMRSSQCLFIFTSRGEVQCRLPILWSYPLVPRQWYARIVFIFMLYGSCFFFLFDTCTELLNRSQTWRPDPFRLSAVTTRGLCVYLSWDLLSLFSGTLDIQSQRNAKQLEPGWRVSAS